MLRKKSISKSWQHNYLKIVQWRVALLVNYKTYRISKLLGRVREQSGLGCILCEIPWRRVARPDRDQCSTDPVIITNETEDNISSHHFCKYNFDKTYLDIDRNTTILLWCCCCCNGKDHRWWIVCPLGQVTTEGFILYEVHRVQKPWAKSIRADCKLFRQTCWEN